MMDRIKIEENILLIQLILSKKLCRRQLIQIKYMILRNQSLKWRRRSIEKYLLEVFHPSNFYQRSES